MTEELVLERVSKTYPTPAGPLTVLREVSLTVPPGRTVAIVGPSGSGKSTLLHLIGSLDQPTSGSVRLGETEVGELRGRELAQYRSRRVGFVFQDHHLLPQLTALENVLLPTLAGGDRRQAPTRARELLERVRLAERMTAFPARLSGGERQRVAVARALINGAGLLLGDEPTGNLDAETGGEVLDLLLELAGQGITVLMVTHNLDHAARFSRAYVLREGHLSVAEGLAAPEGAA